MQLIKKQADSLTFNQVEKLGNTAFFFVEKIPDLTKTRLLKLVYLCEELFVKKYSSPFLGLPFQVWKSGPVQTELYVNLDPDSEHGGIQERSSILANFLRVDKEGEGYHFLAVNKFNDENFSDDEISVMTHIARTYKIQSSNLLLSVTHKDTSLWYRTVIRVGGLFERFENNIQSTSELVIDFGELLNNESSRNFYYSQLEMLEFSNSLK